MVIILIEGFATVVGATQWRRHAELADALAAERYRYETRTRNYDGAPAPAHMLAVRIDEIREGAYAQWGDRSGLAPMPMSSDRRG